MEVQIVVSDVGRFDGDNHHVTVTDGAGTKWLSGGFRRALADDPDRAALYASRDQARLDIEDWIEPGYLANMTAAEHSDFVGASIGAASEIGHESYGIKEYRRFRDGYIRGDRKQALLF
jgi:hypothetical protein